LLTGSAKGRNPQDAFRKALVDANPAVYEAIVAGWESMSDKERRRRYQISREGTIDAPWSERVALQGHRLLEYRRNADEARRRLVRREFARALAVGPANWQPSQETQQSKTLSYLVQMKIWSQLAGATEARCCGRARADDEGEPERIPNYGIKLTRIQCHEHDEFRHDEIYVVSVAVDGNGQVKAETSAKYPMNDGDDNVVYPNKWMYPMTNPKGFLDLAVDLWEDDGGYEEAAAAVAALGISIAALPAGPVTTVAGIALAAIGGLVALGGWLDDEDQFGVESKTWASSDELLSGVGPHVRSIVNYDTGIFDITSYNYDLQFELLTA
jgi:hypothetical protein